MGVGEILKGGGPLLAGESRMHQAELLVELTGQPSDAAVEALDSDYAYAIMTSLGAIEGRDFEEVFMGVHADARGMLRCCLQFHLGGRSTAAALLQVTLN